MTSVLARRRWAVGWLIRPMRSTVGHIDEEGATGVPLDERDGALRDQVRHVAGDLDRLLVLEQIVPDRRVAPRGVLIVVDEGALEAEEVLEAVRLRTELLLPAEMPFSDERRRVAALLQEL